MQSTAIKYASLFLSNFFISRLFLFPAGTFPPTQNFPHYVETSGLQDTYEDIYCIFPVIENGLKLLVKYYSEVSCSVQRYCKTSPQSRPLHITYTISVRSKVRFVETGDSIITIPANVRRHMNISAIRHPKLDLLMYHEAIFYFKCCCCTFCMGDRGENIFLTGGATSEHRKTSGQQQRFFSNQNQKIIIYDKITEIQVLLYPSLVSRNVLFYSFQPREAVDLKFVLFLLVSSEHDFSIPRYRRRYLLVHRHSRP